MRSATRPQTWRLITPGAEQHRQHRGAHRRRNAEVGAQRDQMRLRHRHGHAAHERGDRDPARTRSWAASRAPAACVAPPAVCAAGAGISGGGRRKPCRQRHDQRDLEHRVADHGPAPAEVGDGALEDRRPHEAGEIAAARDQRQRRAAPPVEPLADIDIERRVEPGVAEQAHEQAVPDLELPRLAAGRDQQPDGRSSRSRTSRSSGCRTGRRCGPSGCRRPRSRTRPASWPAPAPSARRPFPRRSPSGRPTVIHGAPNDRPSRTSEIARDDPGGPRLDGARFNALRGQSGTRQGEEGHMARARQAVTL